MSQLIRKTDVQHVQFLEGTEFVECGLCGERRGGWFIQLALLVHATKGSKTFPAVAVAHLDCVSRHMPARLISAAKDAPPEALVFVVAR